MMFNIWPKISIPKKKPVEWSVRNWEFPLYSHLPKGIITEGKELKYTSLDVGFQVCPKCNGEGRVSTYVTSTSCFEQCPVCNGKMIINKQTGKPPE